MTKSEITVHEYRSIVHEMAVNAVKTHLETGEELVHAIDLQFASHPQVQDVIHNHPTSAIKHAKSVEHFADCVENRNDPDEVLEAMALRGFEYDIHEVATTITDITDWLGFEPGELAEVSKEETEA